MNDTVLWLYRAWNVSKSLESLQRSRERAYEQATRITSQLSSTSVSGTKDPHKLEKLVDLDVQIMQAENNLLQIQTEIVDAISQMQTNKLKDVLLKRFVDCLTWEEIAVETHYSYKQTKRNYKSALIEIDPIIRRIKNV